MTRAGIYPAALRRSIWLVDREQSMEEELATENQSLELPLKARGRVPSAGEWG